MKNKIKQMKNKTKQMKNKTKPKYATHKDDLFPFRYKVLEIKGNLVLLSLRDYHDTPQDYYTPKSKVTFLKRGDTYFECV